MGNRISLLSAALPDAAAMTRFLAAIPDGDRLASLLQLGRPVNSRAYDDDTETARYVVSDGADVKCFVVTGVTIDQAEMIAAACLTLPAWEEAAFREAVEVALGPTFDPADRSAGTAT
jgi:hypothetical protein